LHPVSTPHSFNIKHAKQLPAVRDVATVAITAIIAAAVVTDSVAQTTLHRHYCCGDALQRSAAHSDFTIKPDKLISEVIRPWASS